VDGPSEDNILLVLPFQWSKQDMLTMENAQNLLNEAHWRAGDGMEYEHYLTSPNTIKSEDYATLDPGIYLNDTIVNLWMQWWVIAGRCECFMVKQMKLNLFSLFSF
jgi:Ulp1 family protease